VGNYIYVLSVYNTVYYIPPKPCPVTDVNFHTEETLTSSYIKHPSLSFELGGGLHTTLDALTKSSFYHILR